MARIFSSRVVRRAARVMSWISVPALTFVLLVRDGSVPGIGGPDAGPDAGITDAGALGFVVTGQSWANYLANHFPVVSTSQAYGNQWATDGGVQPLVNGIAATNFEEVIHAPILNNLRARFADAYPDSTTPPFTMIWAAQGGARLDQIDCRDDLGAYAPTVVCQDLIDNAATAVANGVTKIPTMFILQGHADIGDGTDPVVWCDRLEQFRVDLQTQFRAIPSYSDGGDPLKLVMMGEGRFVRNASGASTTPFTDGQAVCADTYPWIYLAGAQLGHVPFNDVDHLHNNGVGQVMMSGVLAQAGWEVTFGQGSYRPFMMESCTMATPTQIACSFHVPCRAYGGAFPGDPAGCQSDPPIVFDTIPGQHQWPNSGFRIRNDNIGATITSVSIDPCGTGVNCVVRLNVDTTPEYGSVVGISDEGDAGSFPSRTYAGSNLRTSYAHWPDAGAPWAAGQYDDAGRPLGDDYPSPRSRPIGGIDAGYYADGSVDAGFPDATVFPYDQCYAVRFGGFADGTTTGSRIQVGGGWNNPSGPALSGLAGWTIMVHLRHNALTSGVRNVPFVQLDDSSQYLVLPRFEPVFSNDLYVYITAGAGGSPYRRIPMSYGIDQQIVVVYDGTQGTATNRVRIYRWLAGETGGLVDISTAGAFGGAFPAVMNNSSQPFYIGGGPSTGLWDIDGDLYSFTAWEQALSAVQVQELNSGAAVVDPRNASVAPAIYFPVDDERPGATIVTDEIQGVSGLFQPAEQWDGGPGTPVDGSIPQVIATGAVGCP